MKKKILVCLNHSKKRISYWNYNFKKSKDLEVKTIYQRYKSDKPNLIEKIFEKLNYPIDLTKFNKRILNEFKRKKYDILFIEKCLYLNSRTLKLMRSINDKCKFLFFSNDNMKLRHNQSYFFRNSLKSNLFDKIVLTNNKNYRGLENYTKSKILYLDKSFCDYNHLRPIKKIKNYKFDLIFIGSYEKKRHNTLKYLAKNNLKIDVFGDGWNKVDLSETKKNLRLHKKELFNSHYTNTLRNSKISLNFLRQFNNDTQTSRSLELPAVGSFFLSEYTNDHLRIFGKSSKKILFKSDKELLKKIKKYNQSEIERKKIIYSIQKKILLDGQSFFKKIKIVLN